MEPPYWAEPSISSPRSSILLNPKGLPIGSVTEEIQQSPASGLPAVFNRNCPKEKTKLKKEDVKGSTPSACPVFPARTEQVQGNGGITDVVTGEGEWQLGHAVIFKKNTKGLNISSP